MGKDEMSVAESPPDLASETSVLGHGHSVLFKLFPPFHRRCARVLAMAARGRWLHVFRELAAMVLDGHRDGEPETGPATARNAGTGRNSGALEHQQYSPAACRPQHR